MDNNIINAFCRVDWARLRRDFEDNVVEIGAKLNCKPFYMFEPTLIYPKYTGSFHISDGGKTITDRGITGRTKEDIDVKIIERSKDYKKLIADTYKNIAHLEPHLHDLFDNYKDTDREKAIFAKWANRICKQYHDINPPQVATLPDWAQSTEGAQILNRLAEAGYCSHVGQLYQWTGNPTLWAFFADVASDILKLRKSNKRVPWQLIASAFDNLTKENLKSAKSFRSSYAQGYAQMPVGWEQIEAIVTNK